jgi:hypothetical protein
MGRIIGSMSERSNRPVLSLRYAMRSVLLRTGSWLGPSGAGFDGIYRGERAFYLLFNLSFRSPEHLCLGLYLWERARLQSRVSPRRRVRQPRRQSLDLAILTRHYYPFVWRCLALHSSPRRVRLCFLLAAQTQLRWQEGTQTPMPPNKYEWTFLISCPLWTTGEIAGYCLSLDIDCFWDLHWAFRPG